MIIFIYCPLTEPAWLFCSNYFSLAKYVTCDETCVTWYDVIERIDNNFMQYFELVNDYFHLLPADRTWLFCSNYFSLAKYVTWRHRIWFCKILEILFTLSCCIVLHRVMSSHVINHIIWYQSYRIMWCHITSYYMILYHTISYHIMLFHVNMPCRVASYHITSSQITYIILQ